MQIKPLRCVLWQREIIFNSFSRIKQCLILYEILSEILEKVMLNNYVLFIIFIKCFVILKVINVKSYCYGGCIDNMTWFITLQTTLIFSLGKKKVATVLNISLKK